MDQTCSPITRKTKPKKSISSYKQIIPDFFSKDFLRTTNIYANCPIRSYKKRSCPPAKKPWDPSDPCIRDEKRVCGQPCPKKPRNMHIPPVDDCQAQRPHPCGPVQELVKCRKISMPCCPRPYRDRCPVVKRFEKTYPPAIKPPNPCFSDYVSLYKEFICPECIYKQVDIRPHKNPLAEDEMKPRPQPYMPKIILPHLVKHTLMQKKLPRIDIHMPSVPEELAHCLGNPREIEEAKQQLAKKHRLLCEIRSMVTSYLDCPSTGGNGGGEESVKAINTARHILYNEIAKEKGTQKKIWRINMPNCPGMYRQKCEKFRPRIKCEKVRAPAPCFHECIRDEFPTQCDCECCLQPFKAKYQPVQLPGTPEMAGENYEYLLTTIKDPKDRTCAYTETRVPHSRLMEQAELMRKFPSQEC